MSERLTPRARAYDDMLAEAAEMGAHGRDAIDYANRMCKTLHFDLLVLGYAGADVAAELTDAFTRLRMFRRRR